jgi:hypothetical protein
MLGLLIAPFAPLAWLAMVVREVVLKVRGR